MIYGVTTHLFTSYNDKISDQNLFVRLKHKESYSERRQFKLQLWLLNVGSHFIVSSTQKGLPRGYVIQLTSKD